MNLEAIMVANGIGCCVLVVVLISSYLVRQRRQIGDNLFTAMCFLSMTACLTEMFTFILDGTPFPGARPVLLVLNSLLYLYNAVVSCLWCLYADYWLYRSKERLRKYYPYLFIPAACGAVIILTNPMTHWLFSITEEASYVRHPGGSAFFLLTFIYLLYSIVNRARFSRKSGNSAFFPIWMFLIPIFVGAGAQMLFYGISVAWCSVAIGLAGIYMSLQNELCYIDTLTKLYNRSYLDHILTTRSRRGLTLGGIMVDMDFFKQINDSYGHSVGDEALIDAAALLRDAVPPQVTVVRFAGDEFILLTRTDSLASLEQMKARILEAAEAFNRSTTQPYRLQFSCGCAVASLDQKGMADEFLKEMDRQMYAEKERHHAKTALT